jgi:hypothetical protein
MRDIRDMEAFAASQNAIEEIYSERRRQVDNEGWTPEHDDEHAGGQMAAAAGCYAALMADPASHKRTDLGPYYRMGYGGISRQGRGFNSKQAAAYRAGCAQAKLDAALPVAQWTRAEDIPEHWEGTTAWRYNESDPSPRPYVSVVPAGYSRDTRHCGGVWFMPIRVPEPPTTLLTEQKD